MRILQDAISLYKSKVVGNSMPPCFPNRDHWMDWLRLEKEAKTFPRKFACRDCTRKYQLKMIRCSSCVIPDINVDYIARQKD